MDKSKKNHPKSLVNSVKEIELDGNSYQITPPSNLEANLETLKDIFALSPNTKQWTFEEFTLALEDRALWFKLMRDPIKMTNPEKLNTHEVSRDRSHAVKKEPSVFREITPSRKIKITKRPPKTLRIKEGRKISVKREFIESLLELWKEMGGKVAKKSYHNNLAPFEVDKQLAEGYSSPTLKFIGKVLVLYGFDEKNNEVLRNEVRAILKRWPPETENDKWPI